MAERYLFFNSTQTDRRRYQANDMAEYWASFLTSGLIHEDGQPQLSITANGINRIITVNAGRALLQGHLYLNDETMLKIEEPDALFDRIDRIVIRYDNSIENRYIKAFVKKGVVNENPIAPGLTRENDIYEISLAQIKIVGGKSFIEQADITDERLDTNLCGLASSLVKVPTNIFDEQFKAYMAQIADEWRSWYSSVIDASYITGETFAEHNRQVDRQLANLNAIADIDNRAIGNTGKFYDLFIGDKNDRSAAIVDASRATVKGAVNIDATQLTVFGSRLAFKDGDEVTIVGTETAVSTGITIFQKNILNFDGNTLTLREPITTPLTEGAIIFRSLVNSNNLPENKINILGWSNASVDQKVLFSDTSTNTYASATPTSCATRDGYNIIVCGLLNLITYDEETDTYTKSAQLGGYNGFGESYQLTEDGKFIMCFTGSSATKYTTYGMQLVTPLSKTNTQLTTVSGIGSTDWGDNLNLSLNSGVALEISTYWVRNGKSYFANINNFTSSNVLNIYEFSDVTKGWILFGSLAIKNSSVTCIDSWQNGDEILVFCGSGYRIARYEIDYLNKEIKLREGITTSTYATTYKNKVCVVNNRQDMFIFLTAATTYICRLGADGKIIFSQSNSKLPITADAYLRFDVTDTYLVSQSYVYAIINNDFVTLYIGFAVPSAWGKWYTNIGKSLYKINAESRFDIAQTMRYTFNQPTKNLAGWLTTDKEATTLDVQLSQADADGIENFASLPVTKNGTEYEFMKVDNLAEKARTTLKITLDSNTTPKKLLGAIE